MKFTASQKAFWVCVAFSMVLAFAVSWAAAAAFVVGWLAGGFVMASAYAEMEAETEGDST